MGPWTRVTLACMVKQSILCCRLAECRLRLGNVCCAFQRIVLLIFYLFCNCQIASLRWRSTQLLPPMWHSGGSRRTAPNVPCITDYYTAVCFVHRLQCTCVLIAGKKCYFLPCVRGLPGADQRLYKTCALFSGHMYGVRVYNCRLYMWQPPISPPTITHLWIYNLLS